MRRTVIAIAIGALAVGLTAAPGALAKKGPKNVGGTVTVVAAPSVIEPTTTTVAVKGNVKANSSCRKGRTVGFSYDDGTGPVALAETAVTKSNGDYKVTLPKPTTAGPGVVTLTATVEETVRKVKGGSKGKKKGHKKGKAKKFNCLELSGQTALTIN